MTNNDYKILTREQVLKPPKELFPMIALFDNLNSFIAWLIKRYDHQHGNYSHGAEYIRNCVLANQGVRYNYKNMTDYTDSEHHFIKLWYNKSWNEMQRIELCQMINDDVYMSDGSSYDWLGCFSQWLGFIHPAIPRILQIPSKYYCTERVAKHLIELEPAIDLFSQISPAGLNAWFNNSPDWEVYGRYLPEILTHD